MLAGSALGLTWRWGGPLGLAHLGLYLLALVPGLPIGVSLFGRRHAGAWIVGGALGYAMTCAALWAALVARAPMPPVAVYLLACAIGWLFSRLIPPRAIASTWRTADTAALLCVLMLVPAVMARPLSRLGEPDDAGRARFRAYFTADVLWHAGLTAELAQQRWPARDPFAAPEPLRYYAAYFMVPAASAASIPEGRNAILAILRVNALGAGLLLVASIFLVGWTAVPRASAMGWATALALIGASAEGAYACYRLFAEGHPISALRTINVDAITSWWFQSPTIDGLPRALWYTPQHGASSALGSVALALAVAGGAGAPLSVTGVAGLALGLSVLFSPFLGGLFALVYGLAVAIDGLRIRDVRGTLRQALTIVPFGMAIAFTQYAGVLEGAGAALAFNPAPLFGVTALIVIALALGPLLLPALVGLARVPEVASLTPAAIALIVGLVTLFTVSLAGTDPVWVGWRAGNLILVTLPALTAAGLVSIRGIRKRAPRVAATALTVALFGAGTVTTAADWFNAQDVENERPGPGFRWTLALTPAQQAAFEWIRRATPPRAIVQMDPVVRGREGWVNIPAFGQRVMAAGLPISLVQQPYHRERSHRVHGLYVSTDAQGAWANARGLRIDYLYLDASDRVGAPPGALEKFERSPEFFTTAFARDDVRVYAVLR